MGRGPGGQDKKGGRKFSEIEDSFGSLETQKDQGRDFTIEVFASSTP